MLNFYYDVESYFIFEQLKWWLSAEMNILYDLRILSCANSI